jgi:hypothetical protein
MLAEASTTEISREQKPDNFIENRKVAKKGGNVAKQVRIAIEKQTKKSIISSKNAKELQKPNFFSDKNIKNNKN